MLYAVRLSAKEHRFHVDAVDYAGAMEYAYRQREYYIEVMQPDDVDVEVTLTKEYGIRPDETPHSYGGEEP